MERKKWKKIWKYYQLSFYYLLVTKSKVSNEISTWNAHDLNKKLAMRLWFLALGKSGC